MRLRHRRLLLESLSVLSEVLRLVAGLLILGVALAFGAGVLHAGVYLLGGWPGTFFPIQAYVGACLTGVGLTVLTGAVGLFIHEMLP